MITYNSNDLLRFDFLHENPGNKKLFENNFVYNLNNFTKFKIDENLIKKEIYENIEQHVKDIMFDNFKHENHNYLYDYLNTNDNIDIKYDNNYTLVFDNMQCNIKNILNIQMMLSNPIISIYIPFILCCENINVNKKDNEEDEDNNEDDNEDNDNNNISNILDSYNKLKNKIKINNKIQIINENFYNN